MTYCGHCGLDRPEVGATAGHDRCDERLQMEPPRFCVECRRRMVVQVVPRGWSARCVEHGVITG